MQRQIILDTETTGLSTEQGHRIIEIGCLEMVNRRLTGEYFHVYINPEREIERGAEEVHGITQQFLADKPKFIDIVDEFLEFVSNDELIIHNAPFDIGFINCELKILKKRYHQINKVCRVVDTLVIARKKHPGQQNSLDALCRRYHVDNSNRELHGALLDAELLAQVYLLLTGGQEQLFQSDVAKMGANNKTGSVRRLSEDRAPLPVIRANEKELAAHQAMLARLFPASSIDLFEKKVPSQTSKVSDISHIYDDDV